MVSEHVALAIVGVRLRDGDVVIHVAHRARRPARLVAKLFQSQNIDAAAGSG